MKIYCKSCQKEIPVNDVDLDDKIAKCSTCNIIFNIANQLDSLSSNLKKRENIPMPKNIEIEPSMSSLIIKRKWFSPVTIFLTFFCLFWDGFMFTWYGIALSQKEYVMLAAGSIHGFVGICLTYYVIAGYINKTIIEVNSMFLTVQHKPLPSFGAKQINTFDIKQLYSKEKITRGKNGVTFTYEVHAVLDNGNIIKVVAGLQKSEQALYIEQEIEKYLKIEDKAVEGELPRG